MLAILVMAYLQIRKEMAPLSGALSGEVSLGVTLERRSHTRRWAELKRR
jgi:hypothetical protein